jgi:hypothetical protein
VPDAGTLGRVIDDRADGAPLADDDAPSHRRNRGFWIVAATMALAAIVVVTSIVANLGVKDTIAHAQHSLLTVRSAAEWERTQSGSFRGADAAGIAAAVPDLDVVGGDTASGGLDEVSVYADESTWAAAVEARPGACFFLRLDATGEPTYGSGTVCTGREAERSALDTDW